MAETLEAALPRVDAATAERGPRLQEFAEEGAAEGAPLQLADLVKVELRTSTRSGASGARYPLLVVTESAPGERREWSLRLEKREDRCELVEELCAASMHPTPERLLAGAPPT